MYERLLYERLLSTGTLLWSKMNSMIPIAQIAPGNPRLRYPHNPAPKKQLMFNSASSECTLRDEHKVKRDDVRDDGMYIKNEMAQIAPGIPPLKKAHMIAPNPHSVTAESFMLLFEYFFLADFVFFFFSVFFFFYLRDLVFFYKENITGRKITKNLKNNTLHSI